MGVMDFAGSGVVHMVGGAAALVGSIVVGPRLGRFDGKQGKPTEFAPSSPVFQTLGVFILWLGW
jgi:Amt family ammonium transporter